MIALLKIALLIEVLVGFSVFFLFLIYQLLLSPFTFWFLLGGGAFLDGGQKATILLIVTVLNTIGAWGICQLTIKVVLPKSKVTEPKKLKRYLLYFIVALLVDCYIILRHYFDGYFPFLFAPYYDFARDHLSLDYGYYGTLSGLIMNPSFLLQAVILSLAVTAHFAYMARNYLWGEGSYVASVRDYGKSSKIALLISLGALIFCILTFLARLGLADPNKLDRFVANALLMLFFYSFGLASCLAVVFSVDSICKRQYSGKVVFIGVLGAILFAMFSFVIYLIIFHV